MAIDEDTLELLERRMAERVERRVRGRLFTMYGLIGGGVLAAIGWFGFDLIETVRTKAESTAAETARDAAAGAVSGAVEDARDAAADAETAAERATAEAVRAQAKLQAVEDWRAETQGRLNLTLERVNETTTSINQSLADLQRQIEEADKRVQRVKAEGEATYLDADYADVVQNLADEVARLDRELARLVETADLARPRDDGPAADPAVEPDTRYAQQIKESVDDLIAPAAAATIFAQFPFTRANVAPIMDAIAALGYDVPPWENLDAARGLSELRYFHETDAPLAEAAAARINEVLSRLGWRAEVEARLIDFVKTKPKRGVLELWLDPARA